MSSLNCVQPKMEGQFLASRPMSDFNNNKINLIFPANLIVGLCGSLNGSMFDYARFVGLC